MPLLPVLLLDDHRVFAEALAMTLDAQPDLTCVAVAHSGAEALARARTADVAVAVIDLQLPDGGGLEILPRLRALRPAARLVVLTAHPRADLARRAVAAGAAAFLGKTAPLSTILEAIRSASPQRPMVRAAASPAAEAVGLTPRELDVLRELAQGRDASQIAAALGISKHTTRDYIKALRSKLGVHSQLDAVVSAERLGLVSLGTRY